jgi:hypothetical protein
MTQGNFFTGTTAGGDTLEVTDGTTTNTDVRKIIVSAGTITASSGHTVTVTTGGGGAGGIGGTIAVNQVAFGTGADTIGGSANLTYDATTFEITGASGGAADFLRVTITGGAVSTPFVVDEIGHVGIGAANPNATSALTLNGDGTTYEGIMFQNGGADAFKLMQDGAAFWNDSQINGYDYKIRLRDTAGTQIFSVFSANNTGEIRQGINTGTNAADVDAPLHVVKPTALTNAAAYPVRITHETSGTPAVGLGVGLEFESEGPAQAGVNYVGSIIESVSAAGTTALNTRYDMVFKNYNGAAASEVMKITGTGALTTTTSIAAGTTVSAGTSVSATTTVTAGTIVQAPTITSDEKLIVSRGNTFGAGVVSVANEDLTTLGFGANLPGSVIIKGGAGTTLVCDNIALGAIDDGTRFTVTATEAPVSVAFETPIGGGAIGAYDLPNVGDAVTVQKCVAAAGWIIISTAGTAVKA